MTRYAREHLVDNAHLADHFAHRAEPLQIEYLLRIDAVVLDVYLDLTAPPASTA